MKKFGSALVKIAAAATALTAVAAPAMAERWDDRGGWDHRYDRRWDGREPMRGPGVRYLHPALRDSWRGRQFVLRNFDWSRNGWISRDEARMANREFFRIADRDRDGRLSGRELDYALDGRGYYGRDYSYRY